MAAGNYFSRKLKRKRVVEPPEQHHEFLLYASIIHAEGIDTATVNPTGDRRIYRVYGYVTPGEEFHTPDAEGLPNPTWKRKFEIRLGKHIPRYLNLEVVRTHCRSDPGASTGIALVGRTRIPLPKEDGIEKSGRFGLVRPEKMRCIAEGHIIVHLEIKKTAGGFWRR